MRNAGNLEVVKQLGIPVKGKAGKSSLQDKTLCFQKPAEKLVPKSLFYSLPIKRNPMNFTQFFQQD